MKELNQSFVLYTSYYDILADLDDNDLGLIFKAILFYKKNNETLELPKHLLTVFKFIKNQLDMDNEKYTKKVEKLKANGFKGGRPKKIEGEEKPNGFIEKPKKPNGFFKNHNDNVNDNVNVNVNVNDNVSFSKEKEREEQKEKKQDPFFENSIIQEFQKNYLKNFNTRAYLSATQRTKLMELNSDIPDFKETIPIALEKLKNIEFDLPNFTPTANWLLREDNYTAVLNGTYDKKKTIWEELREERNIEDG